MTSGGPTAFWVGASTLGRIGSPAVGVRRLIVGADGRGRLGDPLDVGPNPMFVAVGDGSAAIAHETADGAVSIWDASAEVLARRSPRRVTGAAAPCHLAIVGGALWVANYTGGTVSVHDAGSGRRVANLVLSGSTGVAPRQLAPHPHQIVHDAERRRVLVPDLGADLIRVVDLDAENPHSVRYTGARDIRLHRGAGPRHLVIAGRFAVVANELDRTVSSVDLDSGAEIDHVRVGAPAPAGAFGLSAIRRTAPDTVVVADRAVGRLHAVLFDPRSGRIGGEVGATGCGGDHPRDMEVTADGRHLVVANQASDGISVVSLDARGVPIGVIETIETPAPACLARDAAN